MNVDDSNLLKFGVVILRNCTPPFEFSCQSRHENVGGGGVVKRF